MWWIIRLWECLDMTTFIPCFMSLFLPKQMESAQDALSRFESFDNLIEWTRPVMCLINITYKETSKKRKKEKRNVMNINSVIEPTWLITGCVQSNEWWSKSHVFSCRSSSELIVNCVVTSEIDFVLGTVADTQRLFDWQDTSREFRSKRWLFSMNDEYLHWNLYWTLNSDWTNRGVAHY